MKSKVIMVCFLLVSVVVYSQTAKKAGGGWSVEHYVDEFGDATNETFWRTSPKSGAMIDGLFGQTKGNVSIYVDTDRMWLRFFYSHGAIRGWILFDDGAGEFRLSIKDSTTGEVVYTGSCYSVTRAGDTASADINFRLNSNLLNALCSPHVLKFSVINTQGRPIGSFSMTGELPYGK